MRVLALDYGAARTGVAVSDASGTLARPVCVVRKASTENGLAEVVKTGLLAGDPIKAWDPAAAALGCGGAVVATDLGPPVASLEEAVGA